MTSGEQLRRTAEQAAQRPFYLASSLLAYARAEQLDDAGLAARLGCDPASLPLLLLCRRPTGEGAVFRADVEAIAERFALNATRLARLIRRADLVVALGGATTDQSVSLLAAARDHDAADSDGSQDDRPPLDDGRPPNEAAP